MCVSGGFFPFVSYLIYFYPWNTCACVLVFLCLFLCLLFFSTLGHVNICFGVSLFILLFYFFSFQPLLQFRDKNYASEMSELIND